MHQSRSQPAPTLRLYCSKEINGLLELGSTTLPTDCVGRLEYEKEQSLSSLVCVEPAQIPIEGILPARALSRVESNAHETSRVISQSSHSETGAPCRCVYVMLSNFSNEPLVVPKATVLGVAE